MTAMPITVTISPRTIVEIKPTVAVFFRFFISFAPKNFAATTPQPTPKPTAISKKTTVIG